MSETFRPVTSVQSAYGHTFQGTNAEDQESCLSCGAEYRLVNNGDGSGEYLNAAGESPSSCPGADGYRAAHGYERHCEAENGRSCETFQDNGSCAHTAYECDCVLCG